MVLSSSDRDDLVVRVERALTRELANRASSAPVPARAIARARTQLTRAVVRDAVDRTLGALAQRVAASGDAASPLAPPAAAPLTAIVSASGLPDLASRLRRGLSAQGIAPVAAASASAGRHTVVTLVVDAASRDAVVEIARSIGAACSFRSAEETR